MWKRLYGTAEAVPFKKQAVDAGLKASSIKS
jgi:hypothetical protein